MVPLVVASDIIKLSNNIVPPTDAVVAATTNAHLPGGRGGRLLFMQPPPHNTPARLPLSLTGDSVRGVAHPRECPAAWQRDRTYPWAGGGDTEGYGGGCFLKPPSHCVGSAVVTAGQVWLGK